MTAGELESAACRLGAQTEMLQDALLAWNLLGAWEGPTAAGFQAEWTRVCAQAKQLSAAAEKLQWLQFLQAQAAEVEARHRRLVWEEAQWRALAAATPTLGGAW
ncbi:hypothetical protein [Boudabousia marimammalium]|uniref:Uncharacterized protein n=1 Tax=Boudabousia marimammalium TaxID=156892 RepID=A0A1Q5PSR7_9ACTO|nr:hypothetical protein [Boudabousia marimammalium]OKL50627.1 hypothetical protein BM477_01355 [Boudabousia marimammalium]